MPRAPGVPPRWWVVIHYRTDNGVIEVDHMIEDLDMLHDIVERGPDFYTIEKIEIRHSKPDDNSLTIERSEKR